jgi:hypothetical protein
MRCARRRSLAFAAEFIERLCRPATTRRSASAAPGSPAGRSSASRLARAFLRDARLVILDEATASLDPASEAAVQRAVDAWPPGAACWSSPTDWPPCATPTASWSSTAAASSSKAATTSCTAQDGPYRRMVRLLEADGMSDLLRLWRLFRPYRILDARRLLLALVTLLANVTLMAISGWFITAMAVAGAAGVAMNYFTPAALIRGSAIARTAGRYFERLISHEATLRQLAGLRVWFYRHLEPLAPARLQQYHSADLLSRIRTDVDALDNFYTRVLVPVLVALSPASASSCSRRCSIWARAAAAGDAAAGGRRRAAG